MGNCCCCAEKTDEQLDLSYREYQPIFNSRYYYHQMNGGYVPLQSRAANGGGINYEYLCSFR
jgi:hypothetical protein